MVSLGNLTQSLRAKRDLSQDEAEAAAAQLAASEVPDSDKAAFLTALADKGETGPEIAAFASAFRARSLDPGVEAWAERAIDIVGTGGDHSGGFNISSAVVLILAAAGIPVMKHGNRGITSKCGSADIFNAALGVPLDLPPERAREALQELGFVFFFAPAYQPAFKHVTPVRRSLAAEGRRTIFNVLGPLLNPGRPAHILMGVFSEAWIPRLSSALEVLGASSGLAAHGRLSSQGGIDELTTASANRVQGVGRLRSVQGDWSPEDFGLRRCSFDELRGGDLAVNVALLEALIAGTAPAGLVDTVVLNAAVGLWICGHTPAVADGLDRCRELLQGGAVRRKVEQTRAFYGANPRRFSGSGRQHA